MGFGSTYAVRRLKYEKVDRVEQIANFRKYFRYYDAFLAKKTGWGKRTKIIPILFSPLLSYCRQIAKKLSPRNIPLFLVENSETLKIFFSQRIFSKWFFNETIYTKIHKNIYIYIKNEYDTRNIKKTSRYRNKSNFYISKPNNVSYHTV